MCLFSELFFQSILVCVYTRPFLSYLLMASVAPQPLLLPQGYQTGQRILVFAECYKALQTLEGVLDFSLSLRVEKKEKISPLMFIVIVIYMVTQ